MKFRIADQKDLDEILTVQKTTKLRGVHDTRRSSCTPLLLYSGSEAQAVGLFGPSRPIQKMAASLVLANSLKVVWF